ncbi:cellulose synthase catalytic subunit [Leptolyngbya sp. 'hensonii']|uniref:glycosyltransferase family 2 protein n=1 Tax=Leptolyngbya sp. 'hensonii' TaxID=1922337 RepID=UPI00094F789C|nr:cellulose synthase catalytic subunit [Leptolyngbya sp. 'hensonii']OLP16542.1 cellulose synthase catalytic subunit [Leptolyngbya sp. 'hensonii']
MAVSQVSGLTSQNSRAPSMARPRLATIILLSVVVLSGLIVAGWFAGEGRISGIFNQLQAILTHPPLWLMVPMVAGEYLLAPTVILLVIALGVMWVSPQPRPWSRFVVITMLLALTIRYITWRVYTLNLTTPLNGSFSIGLFGLELLMLTGGIIQLTLMLNVKDRRREADQFAVAVLEGTFRPSVDILIPTYNEPSFILRRTVIGCQAIDYPDKRVYLLDDTRRPEMEALAAELGCHYLTRPDNRHAKAGNLNHALGKTHGDLIVVFDADFVPTKNFLNRTVGFFQDPTIALIQTPQSFYNADPISRNLGLENILTPEEEVFYRQIQPIRDGAGSVICSGTSFVVRRSALQETGGFVTDSVSEDYFTGIRLTAQGYRLLYLEEKLSAGLAAENITAHAIQRLRWARGTLQAFFIAANPLTIRGLSPLQRLAHLEGLLHWFSSFPRIGFLVIPLAYSFLNVIPLRATAPELMYFFLPYYVVQLSVFSWLNGRSRSALLSDIYSLALTFPLALTVLQVMVNPFSKGFKVTPKGTSSDRFSFNWGLAIPLILLFGVTAVSLWLNLGMCLIKGAWQLTVPPEVALQAKGVGLGWLWSAYNLIMIGIALLILIDVPKPSPYEWFDLRRTVRLQIGEGIFWGVTTMVSEVGAEVALTQAGFPEMVAAETLPVTLEILEESLHLEGIVIRSGFEGEFPTVRVLFNSLGLDQQRCLVKMLFCRPGQWKSHETPGEFQSLLLLFRVLFRPRILFDRNIDISPISVAKV